MDDNGFAYVFRAGLVLVLVMIIWHGGNAIVNLLPPVEVYFRKLATGFMVLHALPLLPWIYIQIVDPVVAKMAPSLTIPPQAAIRIEERAGRYGSFFLLPYPKFAFRILVRGVQSVAKFFYDVASDFEATVLNHPLVLPRAARLRNYSPSRLGQNPSPTDRNRPTYAESSTSTTLTQAEINRACMKPKVVCEDNLLQLRNAQNEQSLGLRTQEDDQREVQRDMRQQIVRLQTELQRHSAWDYGHMYREERRRHNETKEELETAHATYKALQDESQTYHETVAEETRKNAQLTKMLELADVTTNRDGMRVASLEQEVRRLKLLSDNQRTQIESSQREMAQNAANEIQWEEGRMIVPDQIRVVLEEKFAAAVEEKKEQMRAELSQKFAAAVEEKEKQIRAELSQKYREDMQGHIAELNRARSGNQHQSLAEEAANIQNEKNRLQAEFENERQSIETEKQAIQMARDTVDNDRQSIQREKERIEAEYHGQLQLIEQEKKTIRNHRSRTETELQNERQLLEQEKQRARNDRAQLDRDSQAQRQASIENDQRIVQERGQIQNELKKLQDERLRLEQDQRKFEAQKNEVPRKESNNNAGTDEKRRIAELEEEVEQWEKLLHEAKSKDKAVFMENKKLKEDFARVTADNQMLKARLAAPAEPTQPKSTHDTSAAPPTPMEVNDTGKALADVDADETDPEIMEMLHDVQVEEERIKRENEAKEITKDYKFTWELSQGTNPFSSTPDGGEVEKNDPETRKIIQPRSLRIRMGNMYGTTANETGESSSQASNEASSRPRTARKEPVATGQVAGERPRPTTARKEPYTLPPRDPVSEEDEDEEDQEDQETDIEYEEEDAASDAVSEQE